MPVNGQEEIRCETAGSFEKEVFPCGITIFLTWFILNSFNDVEQSCLYQRHLSCSLMGWLLSKEKFMDYMWFRFKCDFAAGFPSLAANHICPINMIYECNYTLNEIC